MKAILSFRIACGSSVFLLVLFLTLPAARAYENSALRDEAYDDAVRRVSQQDAVAGAQATLASLFGTNAVISLPPSFSRSPIALPSFDSKNLEIDQEAVNDS
ncbi:MAG: hypothetical protein BWY42_00608 [Candidatus Omnitrophica bacterium ADurb.Bin277]|nr:MAG: hypothetical protein BWY42_00608 [Candidatus Omnitrophica bacterium ADurb.Bin277]